MVGVAGEGGILIADGLSVGDFEGVKVGSFDRGAMVGDPSGKAGQNVGQAFAISSCGVEKWIKCETHVSAPYTIIKHTNNPPLI